MSVGLISTAALSFFGPSVSAAAVVSDGAPLPQPEAYQQRLVDWIRSGPNGYFHPAVVWRRLGPGGTAGPYAMHAAADIPAGAPLLVVPRGHTIDSFRTHDPCVTVARMLHEYQRGDGSFYAPYLSYLFDDTVGGTSTGLLPSSWSAGGQGILQDILGAGDEDRLEPEYYGHDSVFEDCGESFLAPHKNTPLADAALRRRAEDAHLFWVSRSWTDKMIPVLDMYNHRNGASKNVESTAVHRDDSDITAYALRDIRAGEQLQNTYSECMDEDCGWGDIQYTYLTHNIFADYGFLELYPRRWQLEGAIAEIDEDLETHEKTFRWIFDRPSHDTLRWISLQLARLRTIEKGVRADVAGHRASGAGGEHNIGHEADSLLELYEGYVEVLEMAVEHGDDPVGVTRRQFERELRAARAAAQYDEHDEL